MEVVKLKQEHIIYVLLFAVVAMAILRPLGLPLRISDGTRAAYNVMEQLPDGSTVLWIWDCAPASYSDIGPTGVALLAQMFRKNMKLIIVTFMENSVGCFDRAMKSLKPVGKTYGVDYVDLGFAPGLEPTVAAIADNLKAVKPSDRFGTPLDTMDATKIVNSILDIDMVLSMSSGSPGTEAVIRQIALRYSEVKIVSACTTGQATRFYVYLSSGHLDGLLPGLRAGAEYEALVGRKAYATSGMDALSVQHLFIVGLLVVGNIIYVVQRSRRPEGRS